MKNKLPVFLISILVTLLILFNSPQEIAWGGWNYQTVPTLGPSRTPTSIIPTATSSPTRLPKHTTTEVPLSTSTRINTLQPTLIFPLSTRTSTVAVTIVQSAATLTSSLEVFTATETTANTSTRALETFPTLTETSLSLKTESPDKISTPKEAQSDPQDQQSPPAWLFPFLGSFLLVTFLILLRLILRKKPKKS